VATEAKQETAVEGIKRESDFLRGDLAQQLDAATPNVSDDSEQLLKFHGIYAQDNRDVRRERALAKEALDYIFMIRVAIPGGRLTPEQWLALDAVAGDVADGTLRLTTRQAVQFHGVRKGGLRPLATALNAHLMTSFGACGDVVRNIVTCPGLQTGEGGERLTAVTEHLAARFKPTTRAHWEVFVNGEKALTSEPVEEHSFFGATYLPRKFKIAIAHPGDNCVDVFAQDLGLIPGVHPDLGEGFTVLVGGGLGRNYANPDTFARLADPLTFVAYGDVDDLIAAVIATYRDLGDRTDRKRARMKYVVADIGITAFQREVEQRLGRTLPAPLPVLPDISLDDHLGWRTLHTGLRQVGIRVGAGRVRDDREGVGLRSALRQIAEHCDVRFIVTATQDVLVTAIAPSDEAQIRDILTTYGIQAAEELGPVERTALACVALPTCGQALAESERVLPDVVHALEAELEKHSLSHRSLQLRMTGCPNGCARPGVSELAIVGRTKTSYDVYVGGSTRGDRLNTILQEKVKLADIPELLSPLFARWATEGSESESFGDFVQRVGVQ